ncbi:CoA-acylating methylmalonate-semialdehyde dehydrogenase [Vibrio nomapromontoriensis]|uniref:CoA-acylating methylmalonate-semialdehyde dehydrogenase n=1 Tax=Vibrio nomapromontoriensis TaxID=2910246 RepID=UPI003D0B15EA
MANIGHFIGGALVSDSLREIPVYNPSTGGVDNTVAAASLETVKHAIEKATNAFPAWRDTPPAKRVKVMQNFKLLLDENKDTICELIGQEHGKIGHDALGELTRGIENVEYTLGIAEKLKGEHSNNVGPGIDSWSEFAPVGVVAGITPFNFPAMVPLWMYPIAIACGNCFILKPSEKAPSAPLFIAKLLKEAGLPDGVMNVVNGDHEVVNALLTDDRIKAVSFVGSTNVAEYIYKTAADNGKRCQALGGAKNHAIVMPDADLDNAVEQLIGAAFGSSGERCMALSVAVAIGDDVADRLIDKLSTAMEGLKVGPYHDNSANFGAVISAEHRDAVVAHINSAEEQGAKILIDGRHTKVDGYENGYFVGGTLIDNVTTEMSSYQAEIFGPVLQIVRVSSMEDAMRLVNEHEYGNGTCIFTRDGEAARYFSKNIEVGMVGINIPLPVPVSYHSFGGWKRSVFGDLGAYGPDAVRFYTKRKTITQRWPSNGVREGIKFSFPS